ncbi:MAG: endo-1,4-beta-xylanase [Bacteroidetes bacterium]|nr:endo-1,4-beta-xylanase [Bacteroidota bacterium]
MERRTFLKKSSISLIGASIASNVLFSAPTVLTKARTIKDTSKGNLIFKSYFVQKGKGPHIYDLVWATDKNWDTFYSNISLDNYGIKISDTYGEEKFGINARWNVEGFGYTNITADNGGEFYNLPEKGKSKELNLIFEFAKSRTIRNRKRQNKFLTNGYRPGTEVKMLIDISEGLLNDAGKKIILSQECAVLAQQSLMYALWASEKLELEYANYLINKGINRDVFFFGCDARAFYQMDQDIFLNLFTPLFNYANITFVPQSNNAINRDFEPKRGKHNFAIRDHLVDTLAEYGIKSQGRLLYWFHDCCMPDWMRGMKYDDLLKYAEENTRKVISHFGDRMYAWEMVNELHDWANEFQLNRDQITELTRLITDVAKDTAPNVKRTINNCCPFAEYVQMKKYSGSDAIHKQRTPIQFTKDILEAGIDIDILEQQMYFPYRDLQDTILLIERYEQFKKPLQISEIGIPGGPTETSVKLGTVPFPNEPALWHHQWNEETQGNWIEGMYTLAYSKQYVQSASWFDFTDPHSYMQNGGLLKAPTGELKHSYHRMKSIIEKLKYSNK